MLERYGCTNKFVSVLRQFHKGMGSRVVMTAGESSCYEVQLGVKQGCVIAPVLFNLYVMGVKMLLQDTVGEDGMVQLNFRTDRSLFNLRKLQARTRCSAVSFLGASIRG